jgi:hypothetical protein
VLPKRLFTRGLSGAVSQKMETFIRAAVRSTHLTCDVKLPAATCTLPHNTFLCRQEVHA